MAVVNHQEMTQRVAELVAALQPELSAASQQERALEEQLQAVRAALELARVELAAVYIPELSAEVFHVVEQTTGFAGFRRMDPLKAMEREAHVLTQDIARIEADPRYVRREYLVGPSGSITRELAEQQGFLDPWEHEGRRYEDLPGFLDLYECGYDTPQFGNRWWEPTYWRRWSQGDAICTALNLPDFGDDVLPAYEKVKAEREKWRGEVAKVAARRDEVHALVQKHDADQLRLPRLPEIYLEESREALANHLGVADTALLSQWAQGDPARIVGLQKVAGLKAKEAYLGELAAACRAHQQAIMTRLHDCTRQQSKLARPKSYYKTWETASVDKAYVNVAKLTKKREQMAKLSDRVYRYDKYDRFSLDNPGELWWHEMTGAGAPRYLPRLHGWYQSNPSVNILYIEDHDHHHDHAPSAAAALSGRSTDGLGDFS